MEHLRTWAWRRKRRLLGRFRRLARWEFWPSWAAYVPLLPYLFYLALKYRCATLFTAANPGIPSGGLVGERKTQILAKLPHVPAFTCLSSSLPLGMRVAAAQDFLQRHDLSYPVVLKPDIGERGRDVSVIRRESELIKYLNAAQTDTIIQKYVHGLEFGIFYYRHPDEALGQISSITEKRFPQLAGDGRTSIGDLILRDDRAVCLENVYLSRLRRPARDVPAAAEPVLLAEIGSHCRGAIFLNAAHLETEALRAAIEATAKSFEGFFLGRFDVRSPSLSDLQAGRFEILELNGVAAEPTHIYDPSVSLLQAYRALFRQWGMAFAIGAANRTAGIHPMRLPDLVRTIATRGSAVVNCHTLGREKRFKTSEYSAGEAGC